jgi:hypothetical protein
VQTTGSPAYWAGANGAFPLDDRSALEIIFTPRPLLSPPRDRYVYYPDLADVRESQSVNIRNRSLAIVALVDIPEPGAEGVLFAHGSRFGGHALYVKGNRLHYVNSFVGSLEQKIVADRELPTGEKLILSAAFEKDGEDPPPVAVGTLSLYHGDEKVGEGRIRLQPGKYSLAGDGLCVGRDSSDPVTDDYAGSAPWAFTGGTINRVAVDVSGAPFVDLEREAVAMMSREYRGRRGFLAGSAAHAVHCVRRVITGFPLRLAPARGAVGLASCCGAHRMASAAMKRSGVAPAGRESCAQCLLISLPLCPSPLRPEGRRR